MVYKCVVGGCPNSSDTVIHYILPEEPRRRSLWLQFIERSKDDGETIPGSSRVCGDHFSQDSFTELDLGFTTRFILNVDAVPTVYSGDRATKHDNWEQAEEGGNEVKETCNITISSTISLACVKEEPSEYEVSQTAKTGEKSKLALARHIKQEENECLHSMEGTEQFTIIQVDDIKSESGCSDLNNESRDNKCFSVSIPSMECLQSTEGIKPPNITPVDVIKAESGCSGLKNTFRGHKCFRCSTCGQRFRNKDVLMHHEANHLEVESAKTYQCQHCGKGFALRRLLKAHQQIHKDMEPTPMHKCKHCPSRFRNMSSLKAHMKQHASQVMYKCPVCEEVSQFKGTLSEHIRTVHVGSRLVCSFCDRSFARISAFFKHFDKHVVVTPYFCSTCKVYQLTESGYLSHMRTHKHNWRQEDPRMDTGESAEGKSESKHNKLDNDMGTLLAPASVSEPQQEPVQVLMESEKGSEVEPELMLGAESEFEKTTTDDTVPNLPSSEQISSSGSTEDTDDSEC